MTWYSDNVPERFILKKLILKNKSADDNKSVKNYRACNELNGVFSHYSHNQCGM